MVYPNEDITHVFSRKQGDWVKDNSPASDEELEVPDNLPAQMTLPTVIATLQRVQDKRKNSLYENTIRYLKDYSALKVQFQASNNLISQLQDKVNSLQSELGRDVVSEIQEEENNEEEKKV